MPKPAGNILSGIRSKRKELGLSINQLASDTGLSLGYLSDLENGKVNNPTLKTLFKLAEILETDLNTLVYGEETRCEPC